MVNSPCRYCKDRHMACHDSCEKYAEYKQALEKDKARVKADFERRKPIRLYKKRNKR